MSRKSRNRDYIKRLNYPRQTYAFSGVDWGDAAQDARVRGKLVIDGAPMLITPMPPGTMARRDVQWNQAYGASMDAVMSIFQGSELVAHKTTAETNFAGVYGRALFTAENSSLYDLIGGKQQVQFVVGGTTAKEARTESTYTIDSARPLSLRMPLYLSGWGRTTSMRPTDPDPADARANDDEHKMDRSSWVTGPLDARWDENRGCWRAWQDLIVDDHGQNLSTLVHGTNPDEAKGFPFLRGQIDDTWIVRKTFDDNGSAPGARSNDVEKSATVCTRIDSKVFGVGNQDLVAPWDDVLTIFYGPAECHDQGKAGIAGSEVTTNGMLAVGIDAKFHADDATVGELSFIPTPPEEYAEEGKGVLTMGDIYWFPRDGEGACTAKWRPGLVIDPCEVAGPELQTLYDNDLQLQDTQFWQTLAITNNYFRPEDGFRTLLSNAEKVEATLEAIQGWYDNFFNPSEQSIENSIRAHISALAITVQQALADQHAYTINSINNQIAEIASSLLETCNCTFTSTPIEAGSFQLASINGPRVKLGPDMDITSEIADVETSIETFDTWIDATYSHSNNSPDTFDTTVVDPCDVNNFETRINVLWF